MFQYLKNIKYVFSICVFDLKKKKSLQSVQNNIYYLSREKKIILLLPFYCWFWRVEEEE